MKTPRNNEDSLEGESNQVKRVQWKDLVASTDERIRKKEEELRKLYEEMGGLLKEGLQGEGYYAWLEGLAGELVASIKELKKDKGDYFKCANNEQAKMTPSIPCKLTVTVPSGYTYWEYRKRLFHAAERARGYDIETSYTLFNDVVCSQSDLVVRVWFRSRDKADDMVNFVQDIHQLYDREFKAAPQYQTAEEPHTLSRRVRRNDYDGNNNPPRINRISPDVERSAATGKLSDERINAESLMNTEQVWTYEKCHIFEVWECGADSDEAKDYANFLVMSSDFQGFYDGSGLVTNGIYRGKKTHPPRISICSPDDPEKFGDDPDPIDLNKRQAVQLEIHFDHPRTAVEKLPLLRKGASIKDNIVKLTIQHPKPCAFINYLNMRHAKNLSLMQEQLFDERLLEVEDAENM